jgi:hypothetical protein
MSIDLANYDPLPFKYSTWSKRRKTGKCRFLQSVYNQFLPKILKLARFGNQDPIRPKHPPSESGLSSLSDAYRYRYCARICSEKSWFRWMVIQWRRSDGIFWHAALLDSSNISAQGTVSLLLFCSYSLFLLFLFASYFKLKFKIFLVFVCSRFICIVVVVFSLSKSILTWSGADIWKIISGTDSYLKRVWETIFLHNKRTKLCRFFYCKVKYMNWKCLNEYR